MTPAGEVGRVESAARRAGCGVRSMTIGAPPAGGAPRALGAVVCPDGWGAARFLVALGDEDARDPFVIALAARLGAGVLPPIAYVERVRAFVRSSVRFEREIGEIFMGPAYLLTSAVGDCDDHARLVYALLVAGGVPATLAFLGRPGRAPSHVTAQACVPGSSCRWVETTVDARLGEHPIAAAKRLGILGARTDINGTEVTIMGPQKQISTPAQIRADQQALHELGYYDGPIDGDALRADFCVAVGMFQRGRGGLVVDSLIGPKTRAAIAAAVLELSHVLRDVPTIGSVAIALTGDIEDSFFPRLREVAARLRVDPRDLLAIFISESGANPKCIGTFPPTGCHPPDYDGPTAVAAGINQMTSIALDDVGFRVGAPLGERLRAYASLSATEQLGVVETMYLHTIAQRGGGNPAILGGGLGQLYVANAFPAYLSASARGGSVPLAPRGTPSYEGNAGFDREKKGFITRDDVERVAANARNSPRYKELAARLAETHGVNVSGAIGLVLVLGLASAALWRAFG